MNTQNNKTHKKATSLNHKHSYRKLRRWVLPTVLGAALSTLAFLPTFAEDIPSAPPAGNPSRGYPPDEWHPPRRRFQGPSRRR